MSEVKSFPMSEKVIGFLMKGVMVNGGRGTGIAVDLGKSHHKISAATHRAVVAH